MPADAPARAASQTALAPTRPAATAHSTTATTSWDTAPAAGLTP